MVFLCLFLVALSCVKGRYLPTRANADRLDKLKELIRDVSGLRQLKDYPCCEKKSLLRKYILFRDVCQGMSLLRGENTLKNYLDVNLGLSVCNERLNVYNERIIGY